MIYIYSLYIIENLLHDPENLYRIESSKDSCNGSSNSSLSDNQVIDDVDDLNISHHSQQQQLQAIDEIKHHMQYNTLIVDGNIYSNIYIYIYIYTNLYC